MPITTFLEPYLSLRRLGYSAIRSANASGRPYYRQCANRMKALNTKGCISKGEYLMKRFSIVARFVLFTGAGLSALAAGTASAQTTNQTPLPAENAPSSASPNAPQPSEVTQTQQAIPPSNNDIVVTAQKRDENAQDVPIAITALDTKSLISAGVTGTEDLKAAIPSLNVTTAIGGVGLPRIRGIGATGQGPGIENPVAVYVDGVYYAAQFGILQSLFDTQQVTVLKGPQGTLFGRNATGGLIQITTRGPDFTPTASARFGYGNYDTVSSAAYISLPISNSLAFSVSGQYENQGEGYGKNLYTGNDVQTHRNWAMRGKLLWEPTDATKVLLEGDFNGNNAVDPAFINFGSNTLGQNVPSFIESMGGDPQRDIYADVDPISRARGGGVALTVEHDFGGVSLKSISAWRRSSLRSYFDPDGSAVPYIVIDNRYRDEQYTQEINLVSDGDGPFKWVLGGFYMHDKAGQEPFSRTTGIYVFGNNGYADEVNSSTLDSVAAFADGTYAIDDSTNITAGLRFTYDDRDYSAYEVSYNGNIPGSTPVQSDTQTGDDTFQRVTWRVSVDHRFSPELMTYVSYNRGFRSGAYVLGQLPPPELSPEIVDQFEAGFKSDLFDRRLRFNMSGFYIDQSSIQVMQIVSGVQNIYNANGAEIWGADADFNLSITDDFTLFGGASYTHARYKGFTNAIFSVPYPLPAGFVIPAGQTCQGTFGNPYAQVGGNCLLIGDASGNKLQNTPTFTASAGANYDIETGIGRFTLSGNFYHNSGFVGTPDERVVQAAYNLLNASVTWHLDDKVYITAWGRNLTDEFYRSQIGASNSGDNGYSGPPRTYGVNIGFDF
ncbi:TonB-dependent receptor [Stakelama sp. CBK3Z-3]|uniref:TonB-dependent receptor n=1 Tax=Stakelama flava TaxID=2860338 RepID=A0ABS6XPI6_9SPHN|nr:TonB-dependent receptor [Stakelama flava]MBW4332129.1 TonB-dependent receptor [Stakelama flava]